MKKNGLRNLAIAAVAIVTATTAQAVPVRWSFENVVSGGGWDGGLDEVWRGYLVFDEDIGKALEYNIGTVYTVYSNIRPSHAGSGPSLRFDKSYQINHRNGTTEHHYISTDLDFEEPLTNSGGVIRVRGYEMFSKSTNDDPVHYSDVYDIFGYVEGTPEPDWVSPVPIPASGILLLGAFGTMAAASRKRKTPKA